MNNNAVLSRVSVDRPPVRTSNSTGSVRSSCNANPDAPAVRSSASVPANAGPSRATEWRRNSCGSGMVNPSCNTSPDGTSTTHRRDNWCSDCPPNTVTAPPITVTSPPTSHCPAANSNGPTVAPATTAAHVTGAITNANSGGGRNGSRCSGPYDDPSTHVSPTHGVNTATAATAATATAATPSPVTPAPAANATSTAATPAGTTMRNTVSATFRGTSRATSPADQPPHASTNATTRTAVVRPSRASPTGPAATRASTTHSTRAGQASKRSMVVTGLRFADTHRRSLFQCVGDGQKGSMVGQLDVLEERDVILPLGAPTSVGSLPHLDRDAAIDFVLDRTPELPAAPTCPAIDRREQMIPQAAWGIAGVHVADNGTITIPDPTAVDPSAPLGDRDLSGPPFATWRRFLQRVAGWDGPIKLQVTGPITLGLMLVQAGLPSTVAFRVAGRATSTRARDLLDLADRQAPGVPRLLVFDEPGLVGGLRPELPLAADEVIDLLSGALASAEGRAVTGVHCCGATDWRVVLQAGPDLLSLPVGADVSGSVGALSTFLERGGWVAWGAVVTDGPLGEHPSRSWRQLSAQWCELVQQGCDPVLLRRQALVTPVCGLALHDEAQADHVFAITRRLAEKIHDQVMGIRLSVGA